MTLTEIENTLKSLNITSINDILKRSELTRLPAILKDNEEILYVFDTRDTHWLGILTRHRIIITKDTKLSGVKTRIIELDKAVSCKYQDGIIMDKVLLNLNNNTTEGLTICYKSNSYPVYYGIEAILNKKDPKEAIRSATAYMRKPPCDPNFIGYSILLSLCVGLLLMVKSCFFDGSTEPIKSKVIEKEYELPRNVSVITETFDTVNLKYTFHKSYAGLYNKPGYNFNIMINDDICKAMQDIASKKKMVSNVSVLGMFEDGYFVTTDSYGNPTPVRNIFAFEAIWDVSDIRQYDCEAVPDIWRHATIKNLWMEFRKHIRDDCQKDDNYRKYNTLCSKVM